MGQCNSNQNMVIRHASYGRMRSGRCVQGDMTQNDCVTDVTAYLDQLCSGRSDCKVPAAGGLVEYSTCPANFAPYLEVVYDCVNGMCLQILCSSFM